MKILKLSECTTNEDRWDYYTHVYAWRILRGFGTEEETTCPIDPEGKWYDPDAVHIALEELRRRDPLTQRNRAVIEQQQREADVARQTWANDHGFANFNAALSERHAHWDEDPIAYGLLNFEVMRWIVLINGGVKRVPLEPGERELSKQAKERLRQQSITQALRDLGISSEVQGKAAE